MHKKVAETELQHDIMALNKMAFMTYENLKDISHFPCLE